MICGVVTVVLSLCSMVAAAQELNARVTVNHNQIQGTDASVFDELQQTLTQFINDRQWTNLQFQKNERIPCNFNITVTKYDKSSNMFTCKALIQATRTAYNSSYSTTIYNNTEHNQYGSIKQCIYHIPDKIRIHQNGNIIIKKMSV